MNQRNILIALMASAFVVTLAVAPSDAAGTVWDKDGKKLQMGGDLRYRYEINNDDSKTSPDKEEATRDRVRVRLAVKYIPNGRMEAGFRLAAGDSSINSTHHTLEGGDKTSNFGIDRAYVKYNTGKGFWVWGGKNGLPAKQFSAIWIDSDYNPEGIALGYNARLGNGEKLKLALARFNVDYNSHTAGNDYAILVSANTAFKPEWGKLVISLANLAVDEASQSLAPVDGGDASYTFGGAEAKFRQFRLGGEFLSSDVDGSRIGTNNKGEDKSGYVAYVRAKVNKTFGLRYYFYDIGAASGPMMGGWMGDDFPKAANFTGSRYQVDINTGLGMKIDLRYYTQETKNKDLVTSASNSNQLTGDKKLSRLQANFNMKF